MKTQSPDNPRNALAVFDPDVSVGEIYQADLSQIEAALEKLADGLSPEDAVIEIEMRGELIAVERRLFPGHLERAKIMLRYQALHKPRRKFSRFLKAVNVAHRTAYDLLAAAEAEIGATSNDVKPEAANCADSAQSPALEDSSAPFEYGFDSRVEKAFKSLLRIFKGFTLPQRRAALDAIDNRIMAMPPPLSFDAKKLETSVRPGTGKPEVPEDDLVAAKDPAPVLESKHVDGDRFEDEQSKKRDPLSWLDDPPPIPQYEAAPDPPNAAQELVDAGVPKPSTPATEGRKGMSLVDARVREGRHKNRP